MFSSMLCLVLLSLMGVESVPKKPNPFPACNTIKSTTIDYDRLIQLSPFNIYQINQEIFNCSKMILTGSEPAKIPYTGSSLIVSGPKVFSLDITLENNTLFNCLVCNTDIQANHTTVYSNLVSAEKASWCVIDCAENGIDYTTVLCMGKTQSDFNDIAKFLSTYMANVPGIFNGQQSCDQPEACNFFVD